MSAKLTWKRTTNFTGRNGFLKCNGLDLLKMIHNKSILISPITSKGKIGRCDIEVPLEAIPAVIQELERMVS